MSKIPNRPTFVFTYGEGQNEGTDEVHGCWTMEAALTRFYSRNPGARPWLAAYVDGYGNRVPRLRFDQNLRTMCLINDC